MTIQMKNRRMILQALIAVIVLIVFSSYAYAEPVVSVTKDGVSVGSSNDPKEVASSIQILLLLTVLSIAPSILIMMTSFTRIIIILSFLRNALGTQQMPPNQVLIGLALFLSLFIMTPVLTNINDQAFQPYTKGEITQKAALDKSSDIMKKWMINQIISNKRTKDLELFANLGGVKTPIKSTEATKLPFSVVVPAFMISELAIAFKFGFMIFIPFLIIDMVVSSTLMSMGMMMLPPVMISLPFKILLFVLVDGWNLIVQSIVNSFAV
ncbi:MAG: flagellar type III secretion system pore protein FliP [Clostridia bacterium]|nr:flagellar type III secretion system pore protein FliP [Clostridia bacterium]